MQELTQHGRNLVHNLSQRYGFSTDAITTLLHAVIAGNGTMAQFYHPELGGGGQWMQGGMIMLGDMFNNGLKNSVDGVCLELSNALNGPQLLVPVPVAPMMNPNGSMSVNSSASWWPGEWGQPSASGSQNNARYAIFPGVRRLAMDIGGQITYYDTLDHMIGGISQQQGGYDSSWTFSSQYGVVPVTQLPRIDAAGRSLNDTGFGTPSVDASQDVWLLIEKLGELLQKGLLTEEEFHQKKLDLLNRI